MKLEKIIFVLLLILDILVFRYGEQWFDHADSNDEKGMIELEFVQAGGIMSKAKNDTKNKKGEPKDNSSVSQSIMENKYLLFHSPLNITTLSTSTMPQYDISINQIPSALVKKTSNMLMDEPGWIIETGKGKGEYHYSIEEVKQILKRQNSSRLMPGIDGALPSHPYNYLTFWN